MEAEMGRKGAREEGKGSCLMSHKLWHLLQCVSMCECGHTLGMKTTSAHVFDQSAACEYTKHLIK